MTARTSAGSTIAICAAQPATYNSAGYGALSFTAIGEVTDLGEFGRDYALVTHNPLGSRGTVKKKGSFNEGSIDLKAALDTDDAGQIICKAAAQSDSDYSFKIVTQNGDIYYFQAQVMSFKTSVGSVDNVTQAAIKLELTTNSAGVGVVEVDAP
jgi:hypothetical protein